MHGRSAKELAKSWVAGEGQIAEIKLHGWRLIARRTRLVGQQAD